MFMGIGCSSRGVILSSLHSAACTPYLLSTRPNSLRVFCVVVIEIFNFLICGGDVGCREAISRCTPNGSSLRKIHVLLPVCHVHDSPGPDTDKRARDGEHRSHGALDRGEGMYTKLPQAGQQLGPQPRNVLVVTCLKARYSQESGCRPVLTVWHIA